MLVNTSHSSKLANSVQRDYLKAAADYRMAEQFGEKSDSSVAVKVGLLLTSLVGIIIAISQVIPG